MKDELAIGTHLASLNLFRENDGSVEITVAGGDGAIIELRSIATAAEQKPIHYIEGLIVQAAQNMADRNARYAAKLLPEPRHVSARHDLKVHPQFWQALKSGAKPFEVRRDDRGFKVGDRCYMRQYDPTFGFMSGEAIELRITYILKNEDFALGLRPGYVVMGFGTHPAIDDGK